MKVDEIIAQPTVRLRPWVARDLASKMNFPDRLSSERGIPCCTTNCTQIESRSEEERKREKGERELLGTVWHAGGDPLQCGVLLFFVGGREDIH